MLTPPRFKRGKRQTRAANVSSARAVPLIGGLYYTSYYTREKRTSLSSDRQRADRGRLLFLKPRALSLVCVHSSRLRLDSDCARTALHREWDSVHSRHRTENAYLSLDRADTNDVRGVIEEKNSSRLAVKSKLIFLPSPLDNHVI